eukprot:g18098.t1
MGKMLEGEHCDLNPFKEGDTCTECPGILAHESNRWNVLACTSCGKAYYDDPYPPWLAEMALEAMKNMKKP